VAIFTRKKIDRQRPRKDRPRYNKPELQYYTSGPVTGVNQQRNAASATKNRRKSPREGRALNITGYASRLPYYVSGALIAASLVYCSILGNKVTVLLPTDSGLRDHSYYETQLSTLLDTSLFNHNKLTFDARSYKKEALQSLPEVADMTVRIPFVGRKPVVSLSFVTPALVLHASNRNYVVSSDGLVLAEAESVDLSKQITLLKVQEDVPLKLSVGKPALTRESVAFITDVSDELQRSKQPIESLTLPLGASELYVRIKGLPYMVKFAIGTGSGGAKQQVGAFLAVKSNLKDQTQPSEYIDVRLAERVFVK
jgi:hypothetical protein